MSTKAKSKPGSGSSPAPGKPEGKPDGKPEAKPDEQRIAPKPDGSPDGRSGRAAKAARVEAVTVYLVSDRGRRASWMLGGLLLGGLLVSKFGTVAAAAGVMLILAGAYHTWFFLRTLRFDAGSVVVDGKALQLPTGLCQGEPTRVLATEVGAAYFLRHAVPWNRSAPVLVIEAAGQAYLYPRDWFANEADQRRVMHAVLPLIASPQARDAATAGDGSESNDSGDSNDAGESSGPVAASQGSGDASS